MDTYRIAVIPGDGIGKETVPEGMRVLEAGRASLRHRVPVAANSQWDCDHYVKHGRMMPENWYDILLPHDAIFYGAVGWPATVPDHVSLWGSLIQFRRRFDQYVNLRPCRLMPGIPTPLANRKPGDIDFVVVRENTEGEYSSVGGRMFEGTDREIVFQESIFSRKGVDRILKFAFELAGKRAAKHVTSATKSNGISITMPYWDERFRAMAAHYPGIRTDQFHIDILPRISSAFPIASTSSSARTCSATSSPTSGPRSAGRSASRRRRTSTPSATTRRCSSPCTARRPTSPGKGIANPIGQIWSGALMLDHLGHADAAAAIVRAIEGVLADPQAPRTPRHGRQGDDGRAGRDRAI